MNDTRNERRNTRAWIRRTLVRAAGALAVATALGVASDARAFPGFFAGKDKAKRVNRSTHVVLMMKDGKTSVTVLPDYDGPIKGTFAMVVPVPDDVTMEYVKSMKRDPVDHIDQITSPRFHEFWEKDPCEPGDQIQEWERDLRVKGTGFLGEGIPLPEGKRKLPKEMSLTVEPMFKDGEYTFHLLPVGESPIKWLESNGYVPPEGAADALKAYSSMQTLVVEVDTKRIELTGSGAILSPFRFTTAKKVKVNSTLGLLNSPGMQELFVYTIHPSKRFEVKNYKNVFPPTNLHVDFKVKERVGEFYAGVHDLLLEKEPKAFLVEFAWDMKGCGEPCPNEPIMIHEKLTLGADFFESFIPEEERNPEPPDLTEVEEEMVKAWKKDNTKESKEEIKNFETMRAEVARRKALVSRHDYVLSRVHHRYDAKTLPEDVEMAPAGGVVGGVEIPKGAAGELPTDVKTGGDAIRFQTRYTHLHPNKTVVKCEKPEHHRWGIPPITYRGYRKIWTAQDLATKNRKSHKPEQLVTTPYPALGFKGVAPKPAAEVAPAETQAADEKKDDGGMCAFSPPLAASGRASMGWAFGAALGLAGLVRRRRRFTRR